MNHTADEIPAGWAEHQARLGTVRLHYVEAGTGPLVPDLRTERLPDASPWVMADAPERRNRLLTEFLSAG